jgi:hypothetical protein
MTKRVWYRSQEGSKIEDRGRLTIADGAIEFVGKKGTLSGPIRAARKRPSGFTNWVLIEYEGEGESREAYFVCNQMLGWVGVLGANKELLQAAEAGISPQA